MEKEMKKLAIILFLFITIFSFAQTKELVLVSDEWEDCTNPDGTGLYFDIIKLIFENSGYKLNINIMPYTQSVKKVQDQAADMVVGVYINEVDNLIFPQFQLSADDVTALFLKDNAVKWEGVNNLTDKNVAWMRGYNFDKYIKVKMNIIQLDKRDLAVNMLLKKRIDYFIDNIYDIEETLDSMNVNSDLFETKLVKFLNLYVCFVNNDKGKKLAQIWDQEMKKLVAKGTIKKLFAEWEMTYNYNF